MFNMIQIGKKITEYRKANNMTQMELADKLGISFQAVSNWERGNTMPDISKLPELASIFQISVDELLNEKSPLVESVIQGTVDSYIDEGKLTEQEVIDALPLLKPTQTKEILSKVDLSSFTDISSLLPFMEEEAIGDIAMELAKKGEAISEFLPFMHEKDVAKLAVTLFQKGISISCCLPFMEERDVKSLAVKALETGNSIDEYLPFMDEKDVTNLALQIIHSRK